MCCDQGVQPADRGALTLKQGSDAAVMCCCRVAVSDDLQRGDEFSESQLVLLWFRTLRDPVPNSLSAIVEDSDLRDTQGLQSGQSLRRLSLDEVDAMSVSRRKSITETLSAADWADSSRP